MAFAELKWVVVPILVVSFISLAGVEGIGVNYGLLGDNLPPPEKVVALFKSKNITKLRLFDPNHTILNALRNSAIEVVLGTLNQDLQKLSTDDSYAVTWVQTNVLPYADAVNFRYISAGNEVIPGDLAGYVHGAMQNLNSALKAAGVHVPVTTAVAALVLGTSYPPSQGAFSAAAAPSMVPIVSFLGATGAPLLLNVYPYFTYANDVKNVRLDYALFTADGVVVRDGSLGYTNLFDAMVDATYSAMEKVGGGGLKIVVSETGWPSGGSAAGASVENAKTYNRNVMAHVGSKVGTPKRPGIETETYLFAIFNENLKPAGVEQNFGLYHPDMTEVYHVDFNSL